MEAEVRAAFAYVMAKLGLGRTMEFFFEESKEDSLMSIEPTRLGAEAPNIWLVRFNDTKIALEVPLQRQTLTEFLRSSALHEILHALLWDLTELGYKGLRKKDRAALFTMNEALVRKLECLLRPLVVRSRRSRSSRSSTQSSSTEPSLHTGATLPNTTAAPGATSAPTSEPSSTKRSDYTTEGESRSATRRGLFGWVGRKDNAPPR